MNTRYPAHITVISERMINPITEKTGFPHCAVLLEYAPPRRDRRWYGFSPGDNGGWVDDSNRESWIDTYIRFPTTNEQLDQAHSMVVSQYGPYGAPRPQGFNGKNYEYPFLDCITMAGDMLEVCGIKASTSRGNLFPGGFVEDLKLSSERFPLAVGVAMTAEQYKKLGTGTGVSYTHYCELPYPWKI